MTQPLEHARAAGTIQSWTKLSASVSTMKYAETDSIIYLTGLVQMSVSTAQPSTVILANALAVRLICNSIREEFAVFKPTTSTTRNAFPSCHKIAKQSDLILATAWSATMALPNPTIISSESVRPSLPATDPSSYNELFACLYNSIIRLAT